MGIKEEYRVSKEECAFNPDTARINLIETNRKINELEKEIKKQKSKNMYDAFVLWCEDLMKNGENDKYVLFEPLEEQWKDRLDDYLSQYTEKNETLIELIKALDPKGFNVVVNKEGEKCIKHEDLKQHRPYDFILQVPGYEEKLHFIFNGSDNESSYANAQPIIIKSSDDAKLSEEVKRAYSSNTYAYPYEPIKYKDISFSQIREYFYEEEKEITVDNSL